jgi:hypothetical protein
MADADSTWNARLYAKDLYGSRAQILSWHRRVWTRSQKSLKRTCWRSAALSTTVGTRSLYNIIQQCSERSLKQTPRVKSQISDLSSQKSSIDFEWGKLRCDM